jgi:hypothetical protein
VGFREPPNFWRPARTRSCSRGLAVVAGVLVWFGRGQPYMVGWELASDGARPVNDPRLVEEGSDRHDAFRPLPPSGCGCGSRICGPVSWEPGPARIHPPPVVGWGPVEGPTLPEVGGCGLLVREAVTGLEPVVSVSPAGRTSPPW